MNSSKAIYWTINVVAIAAFGSTFAGVMLFSGDVERLITRSSGIALVVLLIVSQRVERAPNSFKGLGGNVQNFISGVGILAALVIGYLIYLCNDSLPNRRIYVALSTAVLVLVFLISYVGPRIRDKGR